MVKDGIITQEEADDLRRFTKQSQAKKTQQNTDTSQVDQTTKKPKATRKRKTTSDIQPEDMGLESIHISKSNDTTPKESFYDEEDELTGIDKKREVNFLSYDQFSTDI